MRQLLVVLAVVMAARVSPAQEEDLGVRVNRALDRAAARLIDVQEKDGSWHWEEPHPFGRTALCTFALLHAGIDRRHEAVRRALAFMKIDVREPDRLVTKSTYETACVLLLLNALGSRYAEHIGKRCDWLVDCFDPVQGLWGYPDGVRDLSNTQFAAMGLAIGTRHGHQAPPRLWRRMTEAVMDLQVDEGAVRYRAGDIYRATMTHAALICWHFALEAARGRRPPDDVRRAMDRAHRWARENFSATRNPFGRGHHLGHFYYYLYGMSRYAIFFELDRIGEHDWYREGAEELLRRQESDGDWGRLEDTAFAILFLRRVGLTEPVGREMPDAAAAEDVPAEEPPALRPADDVPSLREWLLAGPFPDKTRSDRMLEEQHFRVERLRPLRGGLAGRAKWVRWTSETDRVDLEQALGEGDHSAFYAALWLHPEKEVDVRLWLGADDGLRVHLDGRLLLEGNHHDHSGDDFYCVPMKLAPGRHVLLLKVENLGYYCHFRARISDAEGKALPSLRTSLNGR